MKTVTIIVTTKNEEKVLARCLHSIQKQNYTPIELIVVDNHSTDQTVNIAKQYTKKVYNKGPERSAQRNYGAQKGKGDYYFFIDADMQLQSRVVEDCVRAIEKGKEAILIQETFIGKGYWSKCKTLEKSCYTGTGDAEAARFFTKQLFKKVRGYDEELTGPEDIDMHKRVMKHTTFGRVKGIIHYDENISLKEFLQKRYYYSLSLQKYLNKHPQAKKGEFRFIRKAYVKNWKLLLADPIHLLGFFILRVLEGVQALRALRKTKN
tara:strand:+ start:11532 stop:12323 length:792 start_codon:yes stop_codon:yes gene_type:complete